MSFESKIGSEVKLLSHVRFFETPWAVACTRLLCLPHVKQIVRSRYIAQEAQPGALWWPRGWDVMVWGGPRGQVYIYSQVTWLDSSKLHCCISQHYKAIILQKKTDEGILKKVKLRTHAHISHIERRYFHCSKYLKIYFRNRYKPNLLSDKEKVLLF